MKRLAITAAAVAAYPLLMAVVFVLVALNLEPIEWGQE